MLLQVLFALYNLFIYDLFAFVSQSGKNRGFMSTSNGTGINQPFPFLNIAGEAEGIKITFLNLYLLGLDIGLLFSANKMSPHHSTVTQRFFSF